jgi:hypothetical protein
MTQVMQVVIERLSRLPEAVQEKYASRWLEELDDEDHPVSGNETQWIGGRKPTPEEATEAVRKIKKARKGRTLGGELTIRDMIEEGRR